MAVVCAIWSTHATAQVSGQTREEGEAARPEAEIEQYLEGLGLTELLVIHLEQKLEDERGEAYLATATRLAELYSRAITEAADSEQRARLASKSEELIRRVPQAASLELRLRLIQSRFLVAEQIASRSLLEQASEAEQAEAGEIFVDVIARLDQIAIDADRDVTRLEEVIKSSTSKQRARIRELLETARRHRSLARFYAGWSRYHLVAMELRDSGLSDAISNFGVLLNASGPEPAIDRVPKNLLRFNHVAGAALGVALARSLRGEHADAINWLVMLEDAEQLGPDIKSQLFLQRAIILIRAERWALLDIHINARARERLGQNFDEASSEILSNKTGDETGNRAAKEPVLEVSEARLLAAVILRELASRDRRASSSPAYPVLERTIGDLVRHGQIGHLIELADRFGTLPLDDTGFVGLYVRAVMAQRVLERSVVAEGEPEDAGSAEDNQSLGTEDIAGRQVTSKLNAGGLPEFSDENRTAYQRVVTLLRSAIEASDRASYPIELANAAMRLGGVLLIMEEPAEAGKAYEYAVSVAEHEMAHERALWLAIAAYDRAMMDEESTAREERDRLAADYLRSYPKSERSIRLLLSIPSLAIDERKTAEILQEVTVASPLYDTAQRRLAQTLYREALAAPEEAYPDHAAAFLHVASRLLHLGDTAGGGEVATHITGTASELREWATLARQVIEIVVRHPYPDVQTARAALRIFEHIGSIDPSVEPDFEEVTAYEQLRIRVIAGEEGVDEKLESFRAIYADRTRAIDRFVMRVALQRWRVRADGPVDGHMNAWGPDARRVVIAGRRLYEEAGRPGLALRNPETAFIQDRAAQAAFDLWSAADDRVMLGHAYELDRGAYNAGHKTTQILQRLSVTAEAMDDAALALEAWRGRFAAAPSRTHGWYEARYESIRLLALIDPDRAIEVYEQFSVLNPDLGGTEWRDRFRVLEEELRPAAQEAS